MRGGETGCVVQLIRSGVSYMEQLGQKFRQTSCHHRDSRSDSGRAAIQKAVTYRDFRPFMATRHSEFEAPSESLLLLDHHHVVSSGT